MEPNAEIVRQQVAMKLPHEKQERLHALLDNELEGADHDAAIADRNTPEGTEYFEAMETVKGFITDTLPPTDIKDLVMARLPDGEVHEMPTRRWLWIAASLAVAVGLSFAAFTVWPNPQPPVVTLGQSDKRSPEPSNTPVADHSHVKPKDPTDGGMGMGTGGATPDNLSRPRFDVHEYLASRRNLPALPQPTGHTPKVLRLERGVAQPITLNVEANRYSNEPIDQQYNDILMVASQHAEAKIKEGITRDISGGRDFTQLDCVEVEIEESRVVNLLASLERLVREQNIGDLKLPDEFSDQVASERHAIAQRVSRQMGSDEIAEGEVLDVSAYRPLGYAPESLQELGRTSRGSDTDSAPPETRLRVQIRVR